MAQKLMCLVCYALSGMLILMLALILIEKVATFWLLKDALTFFVAFAVLAAAYSVFDMTLYPKVFNKYRRKIMKRNIIIASGWAIAFLCNNLLAFLIMGLGFAFAAEKFILSVSGIKSCHKYALEELQNESKEKDRKKN
jgi:hypothetical protein